MRHLMTPLFRSALLALVMTPALAAAPVPAVEPQKVSLQPTFTPGYEAKVVMETTRTSTRILTMSAEPNAKPQENSTTGHQVIEFLMRVARSDEKGSTLTLRVDQIDMTAKTNKGEFAWKSTDPRIAGDNTNPVLATMRPALGATITIDFDTQGNVTKVENGGIQMPTGEIVDFIRLAVGAQEARTRWSPVIAPKKGDFKVEVGQKWSAEEKLNSPPLGEFTDTRQFVLSSVSDRTAVIEFTGKFALGAGAEGQAAMFKVKDSAVSGTIMWDRTVGMFESVELNQRIELEGNAQGIPLGFRTETIVKIHRLPTTAASPAPAPAATPAKPQ